MGEDGHDQLNLGITEYFLSILEIHDRSSHIKSYMRYCIQEPRLTYENQSFSQTYLIILEFFIQQLSTPHGASAPQNIPLEMLRDNKNISIALERMFGDRFYY